MYTPHTRFPHKITTGQQNEKKLQQARLYRQALDRVRKMVSRHGSMKGNWWNRKYHPPGAAAITITPNVISRGSEIILIKIK